MPPAAHRGLAAADQPNRSSPGRLEQPGRAPARDLPDSHWGLSLAHLISNGCGDRWAVKASRGTRGSARRHAPRAWSSSTSRA